MKRLHVVLAAVAGAALLAGAAKVVAPAIGGSGTGPVATATAGNAPRAVPGARTATLAVDNMFCASCPFIVKRTLEGTPGVIAATVDFPTATAVVTYDPRVTDVSRLTTATSEMGYPARVIGDGAAGSSATTNQDRP